MFGLWKRKSYVPQVILYTKTDCPLCDEAKALLKNIHRSFPFELTEKNIEDESSLMQHYGTRVPVVTVNGREVVGYPPNKMWVMIAIKAAQAVR